MIIATYVHRVRLEAPDCVVIEGAGALGPWTFIEGLLDTAPLEARVRERARWYLSNSMQPWIVRAIVEHTRSELDSRAIEDISKQGR